MFETLELQNLNKLPKGKIRDFASPEAFHASKVQRLGGDKIKPFTQVCGKFPMPIFALVRNFAIQSCELTDSTPPIVRPFFLAAQFFIEATKFGQGLFQELWRLYFFASVQRQVCVFHTEVCTYTFTRSRQHFSSSIVSDNIKPICSDSITKDLDIANIPFPITVMVEREPAFVELECLRLRIPRFERETDTTFFKEIPTLKLRRTVFSTFLVFWTTDSWDVKKPFQKKCGYG